MGFWFLHAHPGWFCRSHPCRKSLLLQAALQLPLRRSVPSLPVDPDATRGAARVERHFLEFYRCASATKSSGVGPAAGAATHTIPGSSFVALKRSLAVTDQEDARMRRRPTLFKNKREALRLCVCPIVHTGPPASRLIPTAMIGMRVHELGRQQQPASTLRVVYFRCGVRSCALAPRHLPSRACSHACHENERRFGQSGMRLQPQWRYAFQITTCVHEPLNGEQGHLFFTAACL